MSAHVLLNLLIELRKSYKTRGLSGILSLFRNEFNKFNNSGARMLDSIDHNNHMTLKLSKSHVGVKTSKSCILNAVRYNGRHYVTLLNL